MTRDYAAPEAGPPPTPAAFGRHVLLTTGTNIGLGVLGLITGTFAARLLGPHGRGELAAIQMWPALLASIANLGLPQALTYFAAQSPRAAGRYLGSAVGLALLASLPFAVFGYVLLPYVLSAQPPSVVAASTWYLWLLPIQALAGMPYHLLRGRSDFAAWNGLRLTPGLCWLGILTVGWWRGDAQAVPLAFAFLAVSALLIVPPFAVIWRRVVGPFRPDPNDWKPMLGYGMPTVMSGIPQLLNLRLDQMLMAAFLPPQTLGLYVVAVTWSTAVGQLPNALATVLLPRTASRTSAAEQRRVFMQGVRLAVLSAFSVAVLVATITPFTLPFLFGAKFAASVPAALVLVAAAALAAVNLVVEEGLRGLRQPTIVMWAEFAGLFVTAVVLLVLLRPLGIMGAALASLCGYGTVTLVLAFVSLRLTQCSLSTLFVPGRSDVQAIREHLARHLAALQTRRHPPTTRERAESVPW